MSPMSSASRLDAALVVVGMSAREVAARETLEGLVRPHGGTVAFLQLGDPALGRELTQLADAGAVRIVVAGVSLGPLAPAASWLRRVASYWWRERGEGRPVVEVATALVTPDRDLATVLAQARPLTGGEAGLESAAWEQVPGHRHQVLVCRGPRCSARGADRTAEALAAELVRQGLAGQGAGDDDVLVTQTGCQFPCNHAPVVSVQPDDVWYGGIEADVVPALVARHLVGGEPLETHRLRRERGDGVRTR